MGYVPPPQPPDDDGPNILGLLPGLEGLNARPKRIVPNNDYGRASGVKWWQWWIGIWIVLDMVAVGMTLIYLFSGKWGF